MQIGKKLSALTVTTALVSITWTGAVMAQAQLTDEQIANLEGECQELAQAIQNGAATPDGMSEADIATALENNNVENCRVIALEFEDGAEATASADAEATERVRVVEEALIEGLAVVTVPKPEVDVDVPAPNIRVTTEQPSVTIEEGASTIEVSQAQPEISVEIPEIIVRVEIPAPKLYVRTGDPSVNVSSAEPMIEVEQGDPTISVTQGEPQVALQLGVEEGDAEEATTTTSLDDGGEGAEGGAVRVARAEPMVEMVTTEGEATVEFSRTQATVEYQPVEPNVSVTFTQSPSVELAQIGEVEVIYETDAERDERQAAAQTEGMEEDSDGTEMANADTSDSTEGSELPASVTIAELMDMSVMTQDGEDMGSPEAFVQKDNTIMMVISEGGFLGLGDTEVGIPLADLTFTNEGLVLQEMTEEELDSSAGFEWSDEMRVDEEMTINIRS